MTADGRTKAEVADSGRCRPAEAISVITSGIALAAHFGDGVLRPADVAAGIVGAVIKDPVTDEAVWSEYLEAVVRERRGWGDFYRACREVADDGLHRASAAAPAEPSVSGAGYPASRAGLSAVGRGRA